MTINTLKVLNGIVYGFEAIPKPTKCTSDYPPCSNPDKDVNCDCYDRQMEYEYASEQAIEFEDQNEIKIILAKSSNGLLLQTDGIYDIEPIELDVIEIETYPAKKRLRLPEKVHPVGEKQTVTLPALPTLNQSIHILNNGEKAIFVNGSGWHKQDDQEKILIEMRAMILQNHATIKHLSDKFEIRRKQNGE